MTLAAGTRLGPYQISEQLGAGGMGEVYRARDVTPDAQRFLVNSLQAQTTSSRPITVVVNWLSGVTTRN